MRHLSITVCLLVLNMTEFCVATTIHVPSDYPSIQAGIDAAVNGDTVLVAPGTYTGSSNTNIDLKGKVLHVEGQGGYGSVTIDCNYLSYGFIFHSNEDTVTVVSGFSILRALNGGVCIVNASPKITGCYISDCIGSVQGTAVHAQGNSGPIIRGNIIAGNLDVSANITTDVPGTIFENNLVINDHGGNAGGVAVVIRTPMAYIYNNTIDSIEGGGIATNGGTEDFRNNIVTRCSRYGVYGCDAGDYNDIWSNNENGLVGPHDISADPLFVNWEEDNYSLQPSSPCVDAGDPGFSVPIGGGDRIDIGAFEYVQHMPRTLIVPDSFATIQLAVDSAISQDTILVKAGTYNEHVNISQKRLVIRSESGSNSTFIQSDTSRSVTIRQSTVSFTGFSFTGHCLYGNGGGISADSSTLSFYDAIIRNSTAEGYGIKGGGIYVYSSSLVMQACEISNNLAKTQNGRGGGIYCEGTMVLDSCIVAYNEIGNWTWEPGSWSGDGGGVYIVGDDARIEHTMIINNYTLGDGSGGGLYILGNSFRIDSCSINNNTLQAVHRYGIDCSGGGIAAYGDGGIISQCVIANNGASAGGDGGFSVNGYGGGLSVAGTSIVEYCLVANNSLVVSCGPHTSIDAYARGGGIFAGSSTIVRNNTIAGNRASSIYSSFSWPAHIESYGGGCYSNGTFTNNIIAGNTITTSCENCEDSTQCFEIRKGAGVYISGSPTDACNVFYANTGANEWEGSCGATNQNADPRFCGVPPDAYSILDLSPCAPENNACAVLIGAYGVGCYATPAVNEFSVPGETLTNLISHMPAFSWAYYSPNANPEDSFEVAVGTNPDWSHSEMWNPEPFPGPDTSVIYAGLPLADGATYYLRLRVHNSLAWSEWYNTSFRMNSVPILPVHQSPMEDVIVTTTTPVLWLANSSDAENDPLVYDFNVCDGSENLVASIAGVAQQPDSTSWTVDIPLDENLPYHWHARAYDGFEYSGWTVPTSFYVNATEEFPSGFLVYFPPDTNYAQVYDKPVEFQWGSSFDPDPADSVRYRLLIAIDAGFVFVATHDSIYMTSFPVGDLDYSTHYWWKVQAIDAKGNTTTSTNTADFWNWVLGDANGDRTVNVGDAVFLVTYIFRGGPAPYVLKAGDVNGDCAVNIGDAVYLISYVFRGGPAPKVGCAK